MFQWGSEQEKAFCELKLCLASPLVLAYPDLSKPAASSSLILMQVAVMVLALCSPKSKLMVPIIMEVMHYTGFRALRL